MQKEVEILRASQKFSLYSMRHSNITVSHMQIFSHCSCVFRIHIFFLLLLLYTFLISGTVRCSEISYIFFILSLESAILQGALLPYIGWRVVFRNQDLDLDILLKCHYFQALSADGTKNIYVYIQKNLCTDTHIHTNVFYFYIY